MDSRNTSRLQQYASKGNWSSYADKQEVINGIIDLEKRAETAERERDWLLSRVGVNEDGVYFPCGYTKPNKEESLKCLRQQLNGGE